MGKDAGAGGEERAKEREKSREQERFRVVNTKRAIKVSNYVYAYRWSKSPRLSPCPWSTWLITTTTMRLLIVFHTVLKYNLVEEDFAG